MALVTPMRSLHLGHAHQSADNHRHGVDHIAPLSLALEVPKWHGADPLGAELDWPMSCPVHRSSSGRSSEVFKRGAYRLGMDDPAPSEARSLGYARYVPRVAKSLLTVHVRVRRATIVDLPNIARLDAGAGVRGASTSSLEDAIADPEREVVVATMGSAVVGRAKTHYWDRSDGAAAAGHYLGGVTVTPQFRRHGIADALTSARLDWVWKRSKNIWYVVNAQNLASVDLHRKRGFYEVARSDRFHTTTFTGGEGILFCAGSR